MCIKYICYSIFIVNELFLCCILIGMHGMDGMNNMRVPVDGWIDVSVIGCRTSYITTEQNTLSKSTHT